MSNKYLVLVTRNKFGVFDISADHYPSEVIENFEDIKVIEASKIEEYLIETIGRNALIKNNFRSHFSFGMIFHR